jgi:hypothetical protein
MVGILRSKLAMLRHGTFLLDSCKTGPLSRNTKVLDESLQGGYKYFSFTP